MTARKSPAVPGKRELARLQADMLEAVLTGKALPGGGSVRLADREFIERHQQIYLSDENLAGRVSIAGLPKPIRVISTSKVDDEMKEHGDVAYLRFLPPQPAEAGAVWLTLEARLASNDSAGHGMGLSSVQVKFRQRGRRWEATAESRGLAS